MRPVDIEADVKEMDRRKRVEAIMNSKVRSIHLSRKFYLKPSDCSCFVRSWSGWWATLCGTPARTPWPGSSVTS